MNLCVLFSNINQVFQIEYWLLIHLHETEWIFKKYIYTKFKDYICQIQDEFGCTVYCYSDDKPKSMSHYT